MLWLAGLVGVAGVGAASVVTVTADDTDDPHQDNFPVNDNHIAQSTWVGMLPADPDMQFDPAADVSQTLSATDSAETDEDVYAALSEERADRIADEVKDRAIDAPQSTYVPTGAFADCAADPSLAEWVCQGTTAEAVDYQSESESLVLVWDDSRADAAEPDLSVTPDPDDPEVMQVRMGDDIVADVYGDSDLAVSDIIMIPLSAAEMVGLSPA